MLQNRLPFCAQIYVEIERARLTKKLAGIKEEEGNIEEAAAIIQEVAVVGYRTSREVYSSVLLTAVCVSSTLSNLMRSVRRVDFNFQVLSSKEVSCCVVSSLGCWGKLCFVPTLPICWAGIDII